MEDNIESKLYSILTYHKIMLETILNVTIAKFLMVTLVFVRTTLDVETTLNMYIVKKIVETTKHVFKHKLSEGLYLRRHTSCAGTSEHIIIN